MAIESRLAELIPVSLGRGLHNQNSDYEMCVMEAAAYVAGEPWSDGPQCVCPVIASFLRTWNDALPIDEDRNRLLKPYIAKIIGTKSISAVQERRSYLALDWMIRVCTSTWIELVPVLHKHAVALRRLDEITDMDSAAAAGEKVHAAQMAISAVWDAPRDEARNLAWRAVSFSGGCPAMDAAMDAARGAALAAKCRAAWDVMWGAAWRAIATEAVIDTWRVLQPTTRDLQSSACDLLDRMIALS